MMVKKCKVRRKYERGSSIIESMMAICLLLFIFLGMLQIFQWVTRQMISDYAAFYGSKAVSLGYAGENCRKAARLAAIGLSGQDTSTGGRKLNLYSSRDERRGQADIYMRQGEGSGVSYEYWVNVHGTDNGKVTLYRNWYSNPAQAQLKLENAPLLVPAMASWLVKSNSTNNSSNPEADGYSEMYDYAGDFLDE